MAFTIFILSETLLVPIEGWFVDRFGPRPMVIVGGVLVGASWAIDAAASSLAILYAGALIGGIGAGIVYGTAVGNALKWFPDRRGFASGLTAAGFGAGSALTIVPIAYAIKSGGYQHAFLEFGLLQGALVVVAGLLLVRPSPGIVAELAQLNVTEARGAMPRDVVRAPLFWLIYPMFVMVATGGLLITAQLAVIAGDFKVADVPVSIGGLTLAALPFALLLDRIFNGLSRPAFGALSDRIGRELTMFIAFTLQGVAIVVLLYAASNPVLFVVLSGLMFFTAGEIYSLFPALMADCFGTEYATTNYGLLYTGKGVASLIVPIASVVVAATHSWQSVFWLIFAFNIVTALLALFVLRPLRVRQRSVERAPLAVAAAGGA